VKRAEIQAIIDAHK